MVRGVASLPVTVGFPSQRASDVESVSISPRRHAMQGSEAIKFCFEPHRGNSIASLEGSRGR